MKEVYIVKQEWNYYGDSDSNITICANEEAAMQIFNEKKLDSIKTFNTEIEHDEIEDEFEELPAGKWYYRIYKSDNYYECYEEISIEKKEVVY